MSSLPPSRAGSQTTRRQTSNFESTSRTRSKAAGPKSISPPNNEPNTRRTASSTQRAHGTRNNLSERQTEKTNISTRESFVVRRSSPVKGFSEVESQTRFESEHQRPKSSSRAESRQGIELERDGLGKPALWKPQATLVSHTSAPLASRVSAPPLASKVPSSLQPPPLETLSPGAQEAAILEDLLFVFMGYEGHYIGFAESYDPTSEKSRLAGPSFQISKGLDPSLKDLTLSMLKVATHYSAIESFVDVQSREEFGTVNHALCAAIRKLLKDYLLLIAQLEHQILTNRSFTMNVLHLHMLSTSHMLLQLYSLTREILKENSMLEDDFDESIEDLDDVDNIIESLREGGNLAPGTMPGRKVCKGSAVLALLTKRLGSMSGDPAARSLLTSLLKEASRPYMSMLNEWLHHGGIKDPHSEFFVREQKSIRRERLEEDYTDEYWEKRYTIRENDVPPQLEGVRNKVLLAGKYLNVVRECGGVDVSQAVSDVPKTFDDVRFLENVNGAYAYANSSLLKLLLTTHALPARLHSLKHYFFLNRSDFFSYFLELSASELKKPARAVNITKLQSLLDLVLRQPGSVAALDPFKEDVKVQMNEVGLTKWLMRVVSVSGIDQDGGPDALERYQTPAAIAASGEDEKGILGIAALELDYTVPFPLSLVVSRKTVLRYQLLFRYLLSLRHLEGQLSTTWKDHSRGASWKHQSSDNRMEMWKRRVWALRARMLIFVQQVLYFCTAEVIEPNWQILMARLEEKKGSRDEDRIVDRTVDELMQDHVDFLDTCLKECMLTNSKLLKINAKLMNTCSMFATYTAVLSRTLAAADPDLWHTAVASSDKSIPAAASYDSSRLDRLWDNLSKYEDAFSRHEKILLDALNYYAATETVRFLGLCARLSTTSENGTSSAIGEIDARDNS